VFLGIVNNWHSESSYVQTTPGYSPSTKRLPGRDETLLLAGNLVPFTAVEKETIAPG
jgi:hypothetical protein